VFVVLFMLSLNVVATTALQVLDKIRAIQEFSQEFAARVVSQESRGRKLVHSHQEFLVRNHGNSCSVAGCC
jgi:hypothetical protein